MATGMQLHLAESRDRVPLGREQWNALVARNPTRTAFQTWEWFDTWWSAFGTRHHLYLLTLHEGSDVVGIVPLMLVRGPLGLRQLEFIGTPNADYQDLIIPERRAEAVPLVCRFLYDERRRWDMIVLRNLPAQSPTLPEFSAGFAGLALGVADLERQPCPGVQIRGREDEIRKLLDRYSIRRSERRLEKRGAVQFRVLDSMDEIEKNLPTFFEQHVQRWQGTHAASPFRDDAYRRWYHALAREAHDANWLHFSVLECGGRPAAYHFGFKYGDTLSWYKPSFDWEFHRESPGAVLIKHLIENASARGLGELDFSCGIESFKLRFANAQAMNLNLRVFANRFLYRAFLGGARLRGVARSSWHRLRGARSAESRVD